MGETDAARSTLITRLSPIAVAFAVAITNASCAPEPERAISARRTNVLWLTLCTLRADRLGAYGHAGGNSPNIDRLAREGVLFRNALSQAPWTRPSIASMLTGSYPRSLDIEDRERWPSERVLDVNFETAAERLKAAGYATFGITANPNTNATFGFDRGYDVYRDTGKLWRDGYGDIKLTAEDITGGLLSWLETRDPGQPFFAELVMIDVHEPYRTDVAVRRLSAGSDAPLPGYAYDLQLRYLDDVIGDLLGTLAALNLEDTLIVVTADHGEGLGDRSPQDQGHGPTLFDTRLKVPLILHHPGLPRPGLSISTPVELVDILPTLLDLLGVRAKASPLDGRSLLAAIEDGVEPAPLDAYVAETAFDAADASAIRSGPWKLIRDHNLAAGEPLAKMLFAIDSDPGEESDVSEDHPRIAERLLAQLEAWQQAQDARKSAAPPTRSEISPDELDALRELGYIEDRAADPN